MKKTVIIILILLILAAIGIAFWLRSRRPKISFENIDWLNGTVKFVMSVNGQNYSGTHSVGDDTNEDITSKDKKYRFLVKPIYGLKVVQFFIMEGTKTLAQGEVDFKNKKQSEETLLTKE